MDDPYDYAAQDLARMEINGVTALEASTAAISSQIAAIERKVADAVALLGGLRLQLDLFTERRMADIRKYLPYRDCTRPHQVGKMTGVSHWRYYTNDWNLNACRHLQDAESAQGIVTSALASESASIAVENAMNNLELLKDTTTPLDHVLTGRVRHEVLLKRKTRIQKQIQLVLQHELRTARIELSDHIAWQYRIKEQAGSVRLIHAFERAVAGSRRGMLEDRWDAVFTFGPNHPASEKVLDIIWTFLQIPFVHEIPELAQELDKIISALKDKVPEALRQ